MFPTVGEDYRLFCGILAGTENLNQPITHISYHWTKTLGDSSQAVTDSSTLSFNPVRLFDAGNYSCSVTIGSSYLTGNIATMASIEVKIYSNLKL